MFVMLCSQCVFSSIHFISKCLYFVQRIMVARSVDQNNNTTIFRIEREAARKGWQKAQLEKRRIFGECFVRKRCSMI